MFCGTRSFSQVLDDPPSPKLKKNFSKDYKKKNKDELNNPYSFTGRDKFSKTLLVLEEKKEKIMSRARSHGDYNQVRFTYNTEYGDWIPIIIKHKEDDSKSKAATRKKPMVSKTLLVPSKKLLVPSSKKLELLKECKMVARCSTKEEEKGGRRKNIVINWCCAMIVVMVLALLISGRAFAICCTTLWCYLLSVMRNLGNKSTAKQIKSQTNKEDYDISV